MHEHAPVLTWNRHDDSSHDVSIWSNFTIQRHEGRQKQGSPCCTNTQSENLDGAEDIQCPCLTLAEIGPHQLRSSDL